MNLKSRLPKKIGLLCVLYFVQGLPFGFQAKALPMLLRDSNVSLRDIGFAGALAAPWLLKALWAPLVDRYYIQTVGRRKSWIIPMQAMLALTCAMAGFVDAGQDLVTLLLLVFAMNLFAATQDIAVDGLAVDLLSDEELGPGNAAQVVGYKVGMLTGGGLLVYASGAIGWQGLFFSMAALVSCVLCAVIVFREDSSHNSGSTAGVPFGVIWSELRDAMASRGGVWLLCVVGGYKVGESMVDGMFKLFLVDSGVASATVGLWVGTYGMVASILGSITGGWLAMNINLARALVVTASLRVLPLGAIWLLALLSSEQLNSMVCIVVTCAEHFFGGALTTSMFAFMMSHTRREIGATHFTLLATVEVLGKFPGFVGSGWFAEAIGFANLFLTGTVLSALYLLLLWPLVKGKAVRTHDMA